MTRRAAIALALCLASLVAVGPARAEDAPAQADIDAAIRKGAEYLQKRSGSARHDELTGFALLHAGVPADEPAVASRVDKVLAEAPIDTYRLSLAIMLLEAADRDKHQRRIAELAQVLADMQCANGQWSYGDRTRKEEDPPTTPDPQPQTPAPKKHAAGGKTEVRKPRIRLKFGPKGPPKGDNSNTQFALLGLRAAEDAGVEVAPETWALAKKFWHEAQKQDGGYGYHDAKFSDASYGSMTCVGLASVVLCDFYLKQDWTKEPSVPRAADWIAKNFTLDKNPFDPKPQLKQSRQYYWLYSIERAGVFAKLEKFGAHAWYAEGARYLLKEQADNGSWNTNTCDTCFAILFLRKATSPLKQRVYTPGGG